MLVKLKNKVKSIENKVKYYRTPYLIACIKELDYKIKNNSDINDISDFVIESLGGMKEESKGVFIKELLRKLNKKGK